MIRDHHRVYRPYKRKKKRNVFYFLIKTIVVAFLLYQLVSYLLIQSLVVSSRSMEPGINRGEHLFVTPLSYGVKLPFSQKRMQGFQKPQRGEIVLIEVPYRMVRGLPYSFFRQVRRFFTLNRFDAGSDQATYAIKRIIALPGDTVRMEDFRAYVKTPQSDRFLPEQELAAGDYSLLVDPEVTPENWEEDFPFSGDMEALEMGEGQYFVLGDNRVYSSDSRLWQSPLPGSRIIGKVIWRYFPLKRMGLLH